MKYCTICKRLYYDTGDYKQQSVCSKAKVLVDFRGHAYLAHTASKSFVFMDFLAFLETEKKVTWKQIFKELWIMCLQL